MLHLILLLVPLVAPVEAPKKAEGIVVLGSVSNSTAPLSPTKVTVSPGRFVPIAPADGSPSYLAKSPAYRVYRVAKGTPFIGIKYDAAAGAEPEENSWDRDVMVLLARNLPGTYSIQLVKNGEGTGPPVENGAPIDLEVQGAKPPPDDGKKDPPKPPPIDDDKKDKPQPDLVDGPVWLVTVTGPERSIAAAKLVNDTLFWVGLEKSAGHKFRHYAPGEKSAIDAGYAKIHAALGDCLIVVKPDPDGKTGTLLRKVKLPATTAEVSELLKGTVKP